MILFLDDWCYYPTAIADGSTTNKSFLDLAALLKKMGIKNHLFILSLLNPTLKGVDPFSEDLTDVQQTAIRVECELNPWYFIREVLRIKPTSGIDGIPLRANRANISLWWSILNDLDYFLVQPRQTGKSVNLDGINIWYQHFGTYNTRTTLLTKDNELLAENILRLKSMRDYLPHYLVDVSRHDADNQREYTVRSRGNRLRGVVAQGNKDSAIKSGRGITTPFNLIDETNFITYNHETIPAMLGGTGAARDEALLNGVTHANIFASTAGFLDTPHGAYGYKLANDGIPWSELFYDMFNREELRETLKTQLGNRALMFYGSFTHRQLGFTDDWLRRKIAESRQTGDLMRADYLNHWPTGGLDNPLSKEVRENIGKYLIDPVYIEIDPKEKYMLNWYIPKSEVLAGIPNRKLLAGVDMSTAVQGDNIGIIIMDVSTTDVVCYIKINMTNTHRFGLWFADFLIKQPNITVIPEFASIWVTVLDTVIEVLNAKGHDVSKRIYSTIVQNRNVSAKDEDAYKMYKYWGARYNAQAYLTNRPTMGFKTTEDSRDLLFNVVLFESAEQSHRNVLCKPLANEFDTLVIKNTGRKPRIEHATNKNDDLVVAWLLCHWFLSYARNVEHYGLNPSNLRRGLIESKNDGNWIEQREVNEQLAKRDELLELLDASKRMTTTERLKANNRIKKLYDELDTTSVDSDTLNSIDQVISSMRSTKRLHRSSNRFR